MKRSSPLRRGTSLTRTGPLVRTASFRPSRPLRDHGSWVDARAKITGEGVCRIPGCDSRHVHAAHTVGRATDPDRGSGGRYVPPDAVVPLCPSHHLAYDCHALDLWPWLTPTERDYAIAAAGGYGLARRRVSGRAWLDSEGE